MVTEGEVLMLLREEVSGDWLGSECPRPRGVYVGVKPTTLRRAVKALLRRFGARFMTISATDAGLNIELLHHFSLGRTIVTIQTTYPKETSEADTIVDKVPAFF